MVVLMGGSVVEEVVLVGGGAWTNSMLQLPQVDCIVALPVIKPFCSPILR